MFVIKSDLLHENIQSLRSNIFELLESWVCVCVCVCVSFGGWGRGDLRLLSWDWGPRAGAILPCPLMLQTRTHFRLLMISAVQLFKDTRRVCHARKWRHCLVRQPDFPEWFFFEAAENAHPLCRISTRNLWHTHTQTLMYTHTGTHIQTSSPRSWQWGVCVCGVCSV